MCSLKECVKNSHIHISENITTSLTRDCQIYLNYCLESLHYRNANATYTAVKSGIKFLDGAPSNFHITFDHETVRIKNLNFLLVED